MALVEGNYYMEKASVPIAFLKEVTDIKEIREYTYKFGPEFTKLQRDQNRREDFYHAILDYKNVADKDGSFNKLDKESKRFIENLIRDFKDDGLDLSPEKRE